MLYLVTCKSAGDRIESLLKKLDEKEKPYSIVDFFDLTWIESWSFLFNCSKDSDSSDQCKDLSTGELGCYLAHMEVFRRFLNTDEEFCTTFEDDVDLPESWCDIHHEAITRCKNANIHYCSLGDWGNVKPCETHFERKYGQYTRCTHAQILSRHIVKKCFDKRFPICRPIDFFLNHVFKENGLHDALFLQPGFRQKKVKSLIKDNQVSTKYNIFG